MPANVLQSTPGDAMSSCFKGRRNSPSVGIKEQLQQWPEMPARLGEQLAPSVGTPIMRVAENRRQGRCLGRDLKVEGIKAGRWKLCPESCAGEEGCLGGIMWDVGS